MFGIGPLELMVVVVFALVFIGPEKLPDLMKKFSRLFVQARRYTSDIRSDINKVIEDAELEIKKEEIADLREQLLAKNPIEAGKKMIEETISKPLGEAPANWRAQAKEAFENSSDGCNPEALADVDKEPDVASEPAVASEPNDDHNMPHSVSAPRPGQLEDDKPTEFSSSDSEDPSDEKKE